MNILQTEIGNQIPRKKEDMWKRVYEAWKSVAPNVMEELYNSMSRGIADLIKAKGSATNYWLYDVGHRNVFKLCCRGFIGMIFIFIYNCCLMIYRNKMA